MMLGTTLQRQQLRASSDGFDRPGETLTSIIGISGQATGVIALCFPRDTALKLAGRFLSTGITEVNGEVTDALAEVANMVGGSAKSKFELDPPPELSLPTVIEGRDYKMRYPTKSAWIEVPFASDAGDFVMEISFSTN
jgi:chemotaxis protein CheX